MTQPCFPLLQVLTFWLIAAHSRQEGRNESIPECDWLIAGGVQQAADPTNQPLPAPP